MNRQRIEEFRRKLREGRPVRVVAGQVVLEGEPAGQVATAAPSSPGSVSSVPTPGVQVKPHEWG